MQALARRRRQTGRRIALVPTMGYLHEGHVSLVKKARRLAGKRGLVVVSIFVNPTQFGPKEDLSLYPRDLKRDAALCRPAGADVLFVPETGEMYAEGFNTWVEESFLSRTMEGESRPTHFRGVTTVVAKLFNITLPDYAIFGAKDFQQCAVIQRMVKDLNFPLKIVIAPTVRERDGLAMSSRNKYLSPAERAQATVLFRAIQLARRLSAQKISAVKLRTALETLIAAEPDARLDYIAFVNPLTLAAVKQPKRGTQMALAVFIGKTRLIDNATL